MIKTEVLLRFEMLHSFYRDVKLISSVQLKFILPLGLIPNQKLQ